MRVIFLILLLINITAFGYIRYAESRSENDAQRDLLQIHPEKVQLLKPGTKRAAAAKAPLPLANACLEWGDFAPQDAERAASALAKLNLGDKLSQRDEEGYWVYVPPLKTQADAERKAAEIKALGIGDFHIVQDDDTWRWAISLGTFDTLDAANQHVAQLRDKGMRTMQTGSRPEKVLVIRDATPTLVASVTELKNAFPNTQLKAAACGDANTASKS